MNLRDRETELMTIVGAINKILTIEAWKILEEMLWSKRVESLDSQLLSEAKNPNVELQKIYYLQGRRDEARRYADLKEFGESLVKELENVKLKLK